MDMDVQNQAYFGGIGYKFSIYSMIEVGIHPDALPVSDANVQETSRDAVLDTVQDWLFCCFNSSDAVTPVLESRQFSVAPAFDVLDQAHIVSFERAPLSKSFAGLQNLDGLLARHTGLLVGNP